MVLSASLTCTPRACLARTHSPPVVRRVVRHARTGAFPVLAQSCFDTLAWVPPDPSIWWGGTEKSRMKSITSITSTPRACQRVSLTVCVVSPIV